MPPLKVKFPGFAAALIGVAVVCGSCAKDPAGARYETLQNRKNLASSYARGGDFISAIKEIKAAEKQAPSDPEVHLIKGIVYFGLQNPSAAEHSYKKALSIRNGYTKARYNLCGLYITMKKPDAAIEHCSIAAKDMGYALRYAALVNIARAYDMKGNTGEAERFFKQSLAIEPSNIYSRNEYGKLLMKLSRNSEAATQFTEALNVAPGHNEARMNLASALIKTGETSAACKQMEKVLKNKPAREIYSEAQRRISENCN